MDELRYMGHRNDASFEALNDALFEATLTGDEARIQTLQETLRKRFGDLL